MSSSSRIVPEFMSNNKDDTFRIIMPIKLKIDHDNYANSHFSTLIRNETTKEDFITELSPELFFTHYSVQKYFKNGNLDKQYKNKDITELKDITIDTNISTEQQEVKLSKLLSKNNIGTLLGWKFTYVNQVQHMNCSIIKEGRKTLIIPHYAIATYYYYRFTAIREAILNCKLDDLFVACINNPDDASIILNKPTTDINAAFIHRFACQDNATKGFEDIGKHINSYLKFMKDTDPDKKTEAVPIKVKFPVKGIFTIDARIQYIQNEKTNEEYYYVHEILNDTSDIGFTKFTKLIEKDTVITEIDNLEDLQTITQDIPGETTEILKTIAAVKKYQQHSVYSNNQLACGSLSNVNIESKDIIKDTTKKILKINEQILIDNTVDQSLTESATSGNQSIRKTIISSNYEDNENKAKPKVDTHNFDEFNQYAKILKINPIIKNFKLYTIQELPKVMDNKDTKKTNQKCIIQGRAKQYITSTFEYNSLYVGLLDLENGTNVSSSTWVIVSKNIIEKNIFNTFISHYLDDNYSIKDIANLYKNNTNIRFSKKNHEKSTDLSQGDLTRWSIGLLGKITI